jgi:hypothetical protein
VPTVNGTSYHAKLDPSGVVQGTWSVLDLSVSVCASQLNAVFYSEATSQLAFSGLDGCVAISSPSADILDAHSYGYESVGAYGSLNAVVFDEDKKHWVVAGDSELIAHSN